MILDNEKWQELISGFVDILHINMFVVDELSNVVLAPIKNKYGERLLRDATLGFDLQIFNNNTMEQFKPHGSFFESVNRFKLHHFALPIDIDAYTIGYLVIGPIILNKQLDTHECQKLARSYGIETNEYIHELNELRVVSNIMINSIINILEREIKNTVELSLNQIKQNENIDEHQNTLSEGQNSISKKIPSEKLADMILSLAMNITGIECGSFMTADEKEEKLQVTASRGIDTGKIKGSQMKIGEGISGLAAKEGMTLHLKGQKASNNRIRHLLQRPEIKQSLVMPIRIKNTLLGVLNLHTKKDCVKLSEHIDKLENFTNLLSAV